MFHACVQRFDEMDENFLSGKLNRDTHCATDLPKDCIPKKIPRINADTPPYIASLKSNML